MQCRALLSIVVQVVWQLMDVQGTACRARGKNSAAHLRALLWYGTG